MEHYEKTKTNNKRKIQRRRNLGQWPKKYLRFQENYREEFPQPKEGNDIKVQESYKENRQEKGIPSEKIIKH